MGCGCVGPSKDKFSIENILNDKIQEPKEITSNLPISEYVKKVFCLINKVRLNPLEFITAIEQAEKYIKEINGKKIFDNNNIKVSLNEGKKMFQDCANYLRSLQPMEELNFCDEIVIECPKDEKSIRDINYFKEKLLEKKEKFGIEAYFKDSIRVPEISVLLMLIDDSTRNPKKKRETLLNPKYKFIGISSSDYIVGKDQHKNDDNLNDKNINGGANNIDRNLKNKINKPFCAYFTLK